MIKRVISGKGIFVLDTPVLMHDVSRQQKTLLTLAATLTKTNKYKRYP
jgi:hypothetical protein